MDGAVDVLLNQKIVDRLHILILASVGGTNDSADTNSVLINEVHGLLGVNNVAVLSTVGIAFLAFEVASRFLPADLDGGVHDDVGLGAVFAGCFALVLPALLHGEGTEHL